MADTTTPVYSFVLPEIDGSDGTWGTKLNANLTALDGLLSGSANLQNASFTGTASFGGSTGTAGQVLKSQGAGANAIWTDDSDTTYTAGSGLSLTGTEFANTAPDQTVVMNAGSGISVSGTYPTFTVTNSSPDQTVGLTGTGGTTISGTYPNFTINSTDNNTTYTAGTGLTLTSTEFSVTDNGIGATQLNVSGNGTSGQLLASDGDGTFSWQTGGSGGNETLAQTLALGNTTGGTDISVSSGDNIVMAANSTVDGRDVSVDGAKLDLINQGVATTDSPTFAGIALPDSQKATFGAGDDLQIYHDGSDSYVKDAGAGYLNLLGTGRVVVGHPSNGDVYLNANYGGDVELFFSNSKKFETTSTGIDVTGTATMDSLVVDTDTLAVDSTNNRVGIGTTSPSAPLHVQKGSAGSSAFPSGDWAAKIFNQTDASTEHGLVVANRWANNLSTAFEVGSLYDAGNGFDTFMKVTGDGKVGIGTASPSYALSVKALGSSSVPASFESSVSTSWLMLKDSGTTLGNVRVGSSANRLIQYAGGSERLRILADGKVGIGTSSPAQALHVVGSIVATGNITAYYSDERLKDFKGKIDNPLEKLNTLNGYYFTPNETALIAGAEQNGLEVGVSAQEVEKVLPEIVSPSALGKDYKTVSYEKLTPLLIEAVKELSAKVDDLELRLQNLEK